MIVLKWIAGLWRFGLVTVLGGLAGAFITSMFMPGMAAPSGWADVMTAMFTFLGLIFAVSAFFTWKKSKIRDDGYEAAKAYVSAIVELNEVMIATFPSLTRVMAIPGVVPPGAKEASSLVIDLNQGSGKMQAARQRMALREAEMSFWNAKLKGDASSLHRQIHDQSFQYCTLLEQFAVSCESVYVRGVKEDYAYLVLLTGKITPLIESLSQVFTKRQLIGMAGLYAQA